MGVIFAVFQKIIETPTFLPLKSEDRYKTSKGTERNKFWKNYIEKHQVFDTNIFLILKSSLNYPDFQYYQFIIFL